jgi:hypothetical protein
LGSYKISPRRWIYVFENKFPRISDSKIKEWAFVGPEIRELIQDAKFKDHLTDVHKGGLEIIQNITTNFWGS